jgi:hypothetical protein
MGTTDADIFRRLNRIYAAVDQAIEADLTKFPPTVIDSEGFFSVSQEFSGGLDSGQLENLAHSLIHNIANFRDHVRHYAKLQSADLAAITAILDDSHSFQLIKDLSNNDKHGYPPSNGGFSGRSPQLLNVERVLRLTTGAAKGARVAMTFGVNGPIVAATHGGGAAVVATGEVQDKDGVRIDSFDGIAEDAVDACEHALAAI